MEKPQNLGPLSWASKRMNSEEIKPEGGVQDLGWKPSLCLPWGLST